MGKVYRDYEQNQMLLLETQREAAKIDETEDQRFGRDKRGDKLPEELAHRETRLQRIRAAKEASERRAQAEAGAKSEAGDDDENHNRTGI